MLAQFLHNRPVLDIRSEFQLRFRFGLSEAVIDSCPISFIVKAVLRNITPDVKFFSGCQNPSIRRRCRNRPGIHKSHRRHLSLSRLASFPVREIARRVADRQSVIGRRISCTEARAAEGRPYDGTRIHQISKNPLSVKIEENRLGGRIDRQ